jgi:hypothetical protein
MTKNTIVFLEAARHLKVTSPGSLHHGFRRNTFAAIKEAIPEVTQDNVLVSAIEEAVTIGIPTQKWTDLPIVPINCFKHHNRFHPVVEEPSEKFGTTMKAAEGVVVEVAPEEIGDIVLAGWSAMHIGRCMAQLVPFLKWLGYRPERVLVLRSNFVGRNWHWLDWSEAEALAERHMPILRFESLYDLNFRGLALKAMKHCIQAAPHSCRDVHAALETAANGTYRPAFIALLEVIGRKRDDGERFESRWRLTPGIDIWKHAVDGDDIWLARAEDGLKFNSDADFSAKAAVQPGRPITHWVGSGSLDPIVAPAFDTSPYASQFLAANRANAIGFIAQRDCLPRLTDSGRMFLDMLPSKAKDIDAPIRWHDLKQEDAGRADDWMKRHFKMIKRAVNESVPRSQGLRRTEKPAMDLPSNP